MVQKEEYILSRKIIVISLSDESSLDEDLFL